MGRQFVNPSVGSDTGVLLSVTLVALTMLVCRSLSGNASVLLAVAVPPEFVVQRFEHTRDCGLEFVRRA